MKMTLKTLEITWAEACCPPYTDANGLGKSTVTEAAKALLRTGVKNVIIKCGAKGCLVTNHCEAYLLPAEAGVTCIDTTGAGDSFAAGFLFALSEGRTLRECAQYANECGAKAVGVIGASDWIPQPH